MSEGARKELGLASSDETIVGVVYLKEGVASIEFKHDTSDAPHVTLVAPAQLCGTEQRQYNVERNRDSTLALRGGCGLT